MALAPTRLLLEQAPSELDERDLKKLSDLLENLGLKTAADWRAAFNKASFEPDLQDLYKELDLQSYPE